MTDQRITEIAEKFLKNHRILQPDKEGFEEDEKVIIVRLLLEATEELRKDKERLDWLQRNKAYSIADMLVSGNINVRTAIDSAMESERKK